MNGTQLLQVIIVSVVLTVALLLLLSTVRQSLSRLWQRYLPPRYLKPRGVRRRQSAAPVQSDSHDQP